MKNILKVSKLFAVLFFMALVIVSCDKTIHHDPWVFESGNGFYFVNEGGFNQGNSSLSYYFYDSTAVNDLFEYVNGWQLGDIANSVTTIDDKVYIVVNNSGRLEVADKNNLESVTTVEGLNSPRNIIRVADNKAYISSLYSDSLTIVRLDTCQVTGSVKLGASSEKMVLVDTLLFITNWSGGSTLSVVDVNKDSLVHVIELTDEPSSLQVDIDNNLWVLCSGGWSGDKFAMLYCIDTKTYRIIKSLQFPTLTDYPSELTINGSRDTLYYLDRDIYKMAVSSDLLPPLPFIENFNRSLYKLGFDTQNNCLIATDAVDYMQKGYIYVYTTGGNLRDMELGGIIPGAMSLD